MSKKQNDFEIEGYAAFGALVGLILFLIAIPALSFAISYIGGIIVKVTIGNLLCSGLNTLFNTTYFVPKMIPIISATLGWIGGFFKSITTTSFRRD